VVGLRPVKIPEGSTMRMVRKITRKTFMNHIYKEKMLIIFSVGRKCELILQRADFKRVKRRTTILSLGQIQEENQ
jgi:hypothetical protein